MNTFWYNCIYIYISQSRNPKISSKFLAVSTSSFDGVKFFVLHLIHSVMVNLPCYRATYRHGVIPPPRQDSVQSRHLFQGQTGRGPASAVGMRLAKRDSWWRKKTADMLDEVLDEDECVYSCKYRNRIYISNYIYIYIYIYIIPYVSWLGANMAKTWSTNCWMLGFLKHDHICGSLKRGISMPNPTSIFCLRWIRHMWGKKTQPP